MPIIRLTLNEAITCYHALTNFVERGTVSQTALTLEEEKKTANKVAEILADFINLHIEKHGIE